MTSAEPTPFATEHLPADPTVVAPDGSDVRVLLALTGGSMAHFELAPGRTTRAIHHRTVEEIWYVVSGRGQMWRRCAAPHLPGGVLEEVTDLAPGTCLTIPRGTTFQFRATPGADGGGPPLAAVAVTMPPWPGDDEAVADVGPWPVDVGTRTIDPGKRPRRGGRD